MITLKSKREVDVIKEAAEILMLTLRKVKQLVEPGVTTKELDREAQRLIASQGGTPAFKGYRGFPAVLCTSINEEVVHGIPSDRQIRDGDLLSVDIGVQVDGYFADAARTWGIGTITAEAKQLIEATRLSLWAGLDAITPGGRVGDISHAIQTYVEQHGFNVVRDFVGHGIGRQLHEEPAIPNYGAPHKGPQLDPGMVIAIEPMVTMGNWHVDILDDQWTVVTRDGSLSAHHEETVAITETGVQVLTHTEGC